MKKDLISICLLTYNHEKYITDALKGLISQRYQNIELITLDDASGDRTTEIIRQFEGLLSERFVRYIALQNETNGGNISRNVNTLLRHAEGEFIHVISGDDIMLPDCEMILYNSLREHPECILAYGNMLAIPDAYHLGDRIEQYYPYLNPSEPSAVKKEGLFEKLMYASTIPAPTVLRRSSCVERYGEHDESIIVEDYEYWLRLSRSEAFYYNKEPLVMYRRSEESFTNFFDSPQRHQRMRTLIDADYRAKKKYLHLLDEEARRGCIADLVRKYTEWCIEMEFQEGIGMLYDIMQTEGISPDEIG